jgi:hypothetical protein
MTPNRWHARSQTTNPTNPTKSKQVPKPVKGAEMCCSSSQPLASLLIANRLNPVRIPIRIPTAIAIRSAIRSAIAIRTAARPQKSTGWPVLSVLHETTGGGEPVLAGSSGFVSASSSFRQFLAIFFMTKCLPCLLMQVFNLVSVPATFSRSAGRYNTSVYNRYIIPGAQIDTINGTRQTANGKRQTPNTKKHIICHKIHKTQKLVKHIRIL